ncbi:SPFH domain-containing protein [Blautia sp.]|uniref:SPFH domain-containing protein n=1 Tax=Blautia sp. TaxID=1955243 RepID=UPI00258F4770|nr:SPFH domain-containing protein [Blautia sp.]
MEEKDGTSPMNKNVEERILHPKSGMAMLFLLIAAIVGSIVLMIFSGTVISRNSSLLAGICVTAAILILCAACVALAGLKVINPNEALVLALFGKYYGTLNENGFYWVNPFVTGINPTVRAAGSGSSTVLKGMGIEAEQKNTETKANKKVSLKTMTLDNKKQKVNDELGNPIEIGTVVIWKVENATKAVFNVENYKDYLSIQCDAITRNAARRYPYDTSEGGDERSLRGSSQEVASIMQEELQEKVVEAGIKILEMRITHLAYAPEIASAMLQRQQAAAIIDARQKIVEGAVSMVEMALQKLNDKDIVTLDEERKAAMVSNLLVVLCGNKDAQPIVNSGSLY